MKEIIKIPIGEKKGKEWHEIIILGVEEMGFLICFAELAI